MQHVEWDRILEDEEEHISEQANQQAPIQTQLSWIPGHEGMQKKWKTDEKAKLAATGASSDRQSLPSYLLSTLPISVSATKQRLQHKVKEQRKEEWNRSKRFNRLNRIDPNFPLTSFQQLATGTSRCTTSLLVELRTSHFPLNAYLCRIKRTETPACPHCGPGSYKDIPHYLHLCPAYREARHQTWSGLRSPPKYSALYCTKKGLKSLVEYINATKNSPLTSSHPCSERTATTRSGNLPLHQREFVVQDLP